MRFMIFFQIYMHLWVGLGNPGEKYSNSRHNMGAFVIEKILSLTTGKSFSFKQRNDLKALEYIQDSFQNVKIIFPQTFMNRSGESIQKACHFYKCSLRELVVFHDEVELPLGEVRYKFSGGHLGHNGLRDIILKMGSPDFHRIRLGVGRPPAEAGQQQKNKDKPGISDYLLENVELDGMINPEKVLEILKQNFLY